MGNIFLILNSNVEKRIGVKCITLSGNFSFKKTDEKEKKVFVKAFLI